MEKYAELNKTVLQDDGCPNLQSLMKETLAEVLSEQENQKLIFGSKNINDPNKSKHMRRSSNDKNGGFRIVKRKEGGLMIGSV